MPSRATIRDVMKMRFFINTHKGFTILVMLGLMQSIHDNFLTEARPAIT